MLNHGLENRAFVKLPEGVDIAITSAGLVSRSYAYIIDFILRTILIAIIATVLMLFGDFGEGILLVIYFLISWGYNIFYEVKNGQTPGKKRLKIRVVQDNGLPPTFSQIVVRNLIRPADMLPVGYFLGLIVMCFNPRFKRIGDWAAGTIVVYEEDAMSREFLPDGPAEVPSIAFSTEEQLAVLDFTERAHELSPARRQEIANILSKPLNIEENDSVETLFNYARHFAGQNNINSGRSNSESKQ